MIKKIYLYLFLVISIASCLLSGFFAMKGDSAIVDEIAHIPAGYSYVAKHDYRLNPEHPPLLKIISGLPLVYSGVNFDEEIPAWNSDVNGQWEAGWNFIYRSGNNPEEVIFLSRLPLFILSLIFLVVFFIFINKISGERVAILSLLALAFSPTFIGHSHYVTTDVGVAVFIFLFLASISVYLHKKTKFLFLLSSILFGLALSAKFSAFLLIPVVLFLFLLSSVGDSLSTGKNIYKEAFRSLLLFILFLFISFFVVSLIYCYSMYEMPYDKIIGQINVVAQEEGFIRSSLVYLAGSSVFRNIGYYLVGFLMVFERVEGGNTTFLLGEVTNQSFSHYFPVAFFTKESVGFILLFISAISIILVGLLRLKKPFKTLKSVLSDFLYSIDTEKLFILSSVIFILIYSYISITGNLNIGIRHLLPILPLLYYVVIWFVCSKVSSLKEWILVVILVIAIPVSSLLNYPHFISYFNEFSGGRDNGYKILTDSNLDWGQDLMRLSEWVNKNNIDNLKLDYFGGGVPEYYLQDKYQRWSSQMGETNGWVAVSATYLQNSRWYHIHNGEPDYDWLRSREPFEIIGGSILIYYIP